ncbi:MAG TPA: RluA family pseudouridine synthase [Planctomycetaceae bacterium]
MEPPPLRVLCEDGPVLAVDKPAGLLTQGVPRGVPTLEAQVRDYVKRKYEKPGNVYLGIPHRLDRPTSGVIVFARNSKAAARLTEQFHDRRVRKEYLAVVESVPDPAEGTLSDRLRKDPDRAHVEVVPPQTPGAKEASLRYRVLDVRHGRALLSLEPLTGRMHQLRVQLASRGWPVVGDVQYGWGASEARGERPEAREDERRESPASGRSPLASDAIALHARRLTILHPVRYDELTIEAPVPATWAAFGFGSA